MTLSHLLRRTLEVAQVAASKKEPSDGDETPQVSALAVLIFSLSIMFLMTVFIAIIYTYGHVIPTLCMIESPETVAYVPVDNLESRNQQAPPAYTPIVGSRAAAAVPNLPGRPDVTEEEEEDSIDPEIILTHNKPITSSLRKTVQHLRLRAGYWSRFRGLSLFFVWHFFSGLLATLLSKIFNNTFGLLAASLIAEVALARLHLTWVHIVISEPSEKRWYQRIPPWNTWKRIAPAVFLWALADKIVAVAPLFITASYGSVKHMGDPDYHPGRRDIYGAGGQGLLGLLIMLSLVLLIQIPAGVTMVRVAASMLPEEDETIVPFDRTFGGKTTPAILGGKEKIGLVEAWTSYPWASRMRLIKLIAKVALIILALWICMTIILVTEAHIMFGDKMDRIMPIIHGGNH